MLNVKRQELKFWFPSNKKYFIKQLLASLMIVDANNLGEEGYEVSSLYFDSFEDKDFNQKLDGILNREKYRLRIYNQDVSSGKFEVKRKLNSVIEKLSISITDTEIKDILQGDYSSIENDSSLAYAAKLMNMFHYSPKTIVTYQRYAFYLPFNNIRITIDSNLSSHGFNTDLLNIGKIEKNNLVKDNHSILEVKFEDELPNYIMKVLQDIPFTRSAISKYSLSRIDNSTELKSDEPLIPF